jgi:hypothetical protein
MPVVQFDVSRLGNERFPDWTDAGISRSQEKGGEDRRVECAEEGRDIGMSVALRENVNSGQVTAELVSVRTRRTQRLKDER